MNLLRSSILQVEQQKVTVFSPYFLILFMQRFVGCTVQLILSVWKMIYFDLSYLSFPGSLGYIVCRALWIAFRLTYIWYTI